MAKTNPAQFVRQVRQEINRITWATKRETMIASMSVFVMALIASVFFFLLLMAGAEGLEPAAPGFGDRCSTN